MKSRNLKNIVKCQNPEMVYDQDYNDYNDQSSVRFQKL